MDDHQLLLEPIEYGFLFPYEKNFPSRRCLKWIQDNWSYTFHLSAVYIAVIFLVKYLMRDRKPFSLQTPLAVWNALLAVASALAFARLSKDVINSVTQYGSYESVCVTRSIDDGVYPLWTLIFIVGKPLELMDTVFIVLRKRELIFLHWYHHVASMIYAFYSVQGTVSTGRWFSWMNSFAHTLMYTYYSLNAMRIRPPKYVSMMITFLQTSQMAVGCYVNYLAYRYKSAGLYCAVSDTNFLASVAIYFSHFVLFTKFFYDAYLTKKRKKLA